MNCDEFFAVTCCNIFSSTESGAKKRVCCGVNFINLNLNLRVKTKISFLGSGFWSTWSNLMLY